MRKTFILCMFFMLNVAWALAAEFKEGDFLNESVILVEGKQGAGQCQAVRIMPKWYLTAAHCVVPECDQACSITVQLLPGLLQAQAQVKHTAANARVFVPANYFPNSDKAIRYDLALIRFAPEPEDYFYYDAYKKEVLDEKAFLKKLNKSPFVDQKRQWEALQSARPTLYTVDNGGTRKLLFPIAMPDWRSGELTIYRSDNAFYYFPQLRYYMGWDFGVGHGMSGGGVALPGGHLIGIISTFMSQTGKMILYNEQDEPIDSVPYSSEYFLFTPLSQENANFIKATILSFHEPGASPDLEYLPNRYYQRTEDKVQDVFGDVAEK